MSCVCVPVCLCVVCAVCRGRACHVSHLVLADSPSDAARATPRRRRAVGRGSAGLEQGRVAPERFEMQLLAGRGRGAV
eukprot:15479641-Alexandrium_andersonii.AAC.1